MKDYYETLGVSPTATQDEIKKAYRELARKWHPDVNHAEDAAERFKEISIANDTLSNEEKRKNYDQFGANPPPQNPNATSGWGYGGAQSFHFHVQRPNMAVIVQVAFTLEEFLQPVTHSVVYERVLACSQCRGEGGQKNSQQKQCPDCNGSGTSVYTSPMGYQLTPCARCRQRGRVYVDICSACRGLGLKRERITRELVFPTNSLGMQYMVPECGNQEDINQPIAPLIIHVLAKPHPVFEVLPDKSLLRKVYVDPVTAILGGKIKVVTLEGAEEECEVPARTHERAQLRLANRGLYRTELRADLVAEVEYAFPDALSPEKEAALRRYLDLG